MSDLKVVRAIMLKINEYIDNKDVTKALGELLEELDYHGTEPVELGTTIAIYGCSFDPNGNPSVMDEIRGNLNEPLEDYDNPYILAGQEHASSYNAAAAYAAPTEDLPTFRVCVNCPSMDLKQKSKIISILKEKGFSFQGSCGILKDKKAIIYDNCSYRDALHYKSELEKTKDVYIPAFIVEV